MIIISNTTPIIYFAKIDKLSLLKDLYSQIYIPTEVWNELITPLTSKKEEIPLDLKYEIEAKEAGWIIVRDPEKDEYIEVALNLFNELGRGEAYAIALYLELHADLLLINDQKAKEIAEKMGININGFLKFF